MNKIAMFRVGEHDLPFPSRAHGGDAGLDLCSAVCDFDLHQGGEVLLNTGFGVEIPRGHFGLVALRSSAGKAGLILRNTVGIIDSQYRGEILLMLKNTSKAVIEIRRGQRVAQLLILPCFIGDVVEIAQPSETARGAGGFGSSGR